MSLATQGRAREYRVRDHLAGFGWQPIMRAAASKGAADLLLGHPTHGAALVQVGAASKSLSPAARARFCDAADLVGALPLLAIMPRGEPPTFWLINRGPASEWQMYRPESADA